MLQMHVGSSLVTIYAAASMLLIAAMLGLCILCRALAVPLKRLMGTPTLPEMPTGSAASLPPVFAHFVAGMEKAIHSLFPDTDSEANETGWAWLYLLGSIPLDLFEYWAYRLSIHVIFPGLGIENVGALALVFALTVVASQAIEIKDRSLHLRNRSMVVAFLLLVALVSAMGGYGTYWSCIEEGGYEPLLLGVAILMSVLLRALLSFVGSVAGAIPCQRLFPSLAALVCNAVFLAVGLLVWLLIGGARQGPSWLLFLLRLGIYVVRRLAIELVNVLAAIGHLLMTARIRRRLELEFPMAGEVVGSIFNVAGVGRVPDATIVQLYGKWLGWHPLGEFTAEGGRFEGAIDLGQHPHLTDARTLELRAFVGRIRSNRVRVGRRDDRHSVPPVVTEMQNGRASEWAPIVSGRGK